jgi:glyoxylase-like metal-dependent hydrolase (beta-lactamase superfamily II)
MWSKKIGLALAACVAAASMAAPQAGRAQSRAKAPASTRLYIFDCGVIKGLGVELFGFKKDEVPIRDFFVPCYLVAHPKGTLMWEAGLLPDSAFKADGAPVTEGVSTVNKPLLPQLAALGYTPADITFLGLSHYHSDHTGNANAFAGSTWLVRPIERDAMFAEKPAGIIQQATFSALKTSKTILLTADEHDVFGDGTVVIKSAPGHTPGHQVLFLKLKKTGPLLVAGDLYHYPEEQTMNRFPSFEFNKEQSAASRKAIDAFVKKTRAQMWIEHDAATNATLKKAPAYYE